MTTPNQWRKSRHLPVLSSRADLFYGRLETDVSNTAFREGKEFRISLEFSVAADPAVFRFTSPVDFILQLQSLSCDAVGIRYSAYRDSQGAATGTFGTPVNIYRQNFTANAKDLDPLATIDTNGDFTPNDGELPVEVVRLRVANATAQRSTITGLIGDERGIGAGTYYLIVERLPGETGTALGTFDLQWEEIRPDE